MDFKSKLIPALQKRESWQYMVSAIEKVNEQVFDPILVRFRSLSNVFEMQDEELDVLFKELGRNFTVGESEIQDKSLVLLQRSDEVHFKGHRYSIQRALEREFGSTFIDLLPLYAPKNQVDFPYGDLYGTAPELDFFDRAFGNTNGWFLTSRLVVETSAERLNERYGGYDAGTIERFERDVNRLINPLLPVRIVFDGVRFITTASTDINLSISASVTDEISDLDTVITTSIDASMVGQMVDEVVTHVSPVNEDPHTLGRLSTRLDLRPLDAHSLDVEVFNETATTPRLTRFDMRPLDAWSLDKAV